MTEVSQKRAFFGEIGKFIWHIYIIFSFGV